MTPNNAAFALFPDEADDIHMERKGFIRSRGIDHLARRLCRMMRKHNAKVHMVNYRDRRSLPPIHIPMPQIGGRPIYIPRAFFTR